MNVLITAMEIGRTAEWVEWLALPAEVGIMDEGHRKLAKPCHCSNHTAQLQDKNYNMGVLTTLVCIQWRVAFTSRDKVFKVFAFQRMCMARGSGYLKIVAVESQTWNYSSVHSFRNLCMSHNLCV